MTRDECGTARRLTCQYHSWSYGTDGTLKAVPDARSFVDLDMATLGLVPVRCESWDGWVFVNEDIEAEPLVEYGGQAEQIVNNGLLWNDPKSKCYIGDDSKLKLKVSEMAKAWRTKDAATVRSLLQEIRSAVPQT